jgi:dynein heavy chain, axonemal
MNIVNQELYDKLSVELYDVQSRENLTHYESEGHNSTKYSVARKNMFVRDNELSQQLGVLVDTDSIKQKS